MPSSYQTKSHSRDPRKTTSHSLPSSLNDTSPGLRIPAKEHQEYQKWYENEVEQNPLSWKKLYHDFLENPASSLLSAIILGATTLVAIIAGVLIVFLLPAPEPTSFSPSNYRWNAYKKVPADKIGYFPDSAILLNMKNPTCIALDANDRIFVGGDRKISVFSLDGGLHFTIPLKANPTCVTIPKSHDPNAQLLFENHLIVGFPGFLEVYAPQTDGHFEKTPIFTWQLPGTNAYLREICPEKQSLLLADAGEKGFMRIDAEGGIQLKVGFSQPLSNPPGTNGEEFLGFSIPSLPFLDIVVSPQDQLLYVTNPGKHRIEAFSHDGLWQSENAWGSYAVNYEGFCGCCNPSGLEVFPDGRFLTTEKYLPRVKVYDSSGQILTVVVSPEGLEQPPTHLKNAPEDITIPYRSFPEAEQIVYAAITSREHIAVLDPRYGVIRFYVPRQSGEQKE